MDPPVRRRKRPDRQAGRANYYNKTRTRYHQALREPSQAEGYPAWRFASYAIQGFTEELRDQIATIQQHQLSLAWLKIVGEAQLGRTEAAISRRQQLLPVLP